MRLLHVTDVHCNLDNLHEVIERHWREVDLIAITGDICCDSKLRDILSRAGRRVLAVTGNMDDLHIARVLRDNGWLLDGRIEVIDGFVYAGVGGLQAIQDLRRVIESLHKLQEHNKRLIVLSHYPAHGYLDLTFSGVHAGLYELREFIEEAKPIVFLHGHIHEAKGVARYRSTLIVNPGPLAEGNYAIVEVEGGEAHAELYHL